MGFFVFDDKEDYFKNNTSIFHNKYFKDNTSLSFMTKKISLKTILLSFTTSSSKTKKITSKTILLSFTTLHNKYFKDFFVFDEEDYFKSNTFTTFHNTYFKDNTSSKISETQTT